jgi:predicted HicB family RNase H-like nuclease
MKKNDKRKLMKVIEWSDEDQCYIGSALPLIGPCCHGKDEMSVLRQLNDIIESWSHVSPLKEPQKSYTGKFLLRISPELHKTLAIKAQQQQTSLNRYCEEQLMR